MYGTSVSKNHYTWFGHCCNEFSVQTSSYIKSLIAAIIVNLYIINMNPLARTIGYV